MVDHAPVRVVEIAVEPKGGADGAKLAAALAQLVAEDPALAFEIDQESGRTILKGTSELHLDEAIGVLRDRLEINFGAPQVAYRETITRPADIDLTHKRITGPTAHFARVRLHAAPEPAGAGVVFASMIAAGALPEVFVAGVETGVRSVLPAGLVAGFPVVDIRIELLDGAYHETDSTERVFAIASRAAMLEALQKGCATLLEPLMTVDVTTPGDCEEAVVVDLRSRRGEIESRSARGEATMVTASIPLANLFGYHNSLRSMTRGAGACAMRFARYAPVPGPDDFDPPSAAMALRG